MVAPSIVLGARPTNVWSHGVRPDVDQIAADDCFKRIACRNRQFQDRIGKGRIGDLGRRNGGEGRRKNSRPNAQPSQENGGQGETSSQRDRNARMDGGQRQVKFRQGEITGADDQQLERIFRQAAGVQQCENFWCRETSHGTPPTNCAVLASLSCAPASFTARTNVTLLTNATEAELRPARDNFRRIIDPQRGTLVRRDCVSAWQGSRMAKEKSSTKPYASSCFVQTGETGAVLFSIQAALLKPRSVAFFQSRYSKEPLAPIG
jgi:hypothetical protein